MSDKQHKKIIEEYAFLCKEYNALIGLNFSTKKVERDVYSKLSVNQLTIDDIQMDMELLKIDIDIIKNNDNKDSQKKSKNKHQKKHS